MENIGFHLFADLAGFKNPEILFNGPRPDIVVKSGNKLTVMDFYTVNSHYHAAMKRILRKLVIIK